MPNSWRLMHRRRPGRHKLFCEFRFSWDKLWCDDPGYSPTRKQCGEPGYVECRYHVWEEPGNRYCCEHAHLKGFCQSCGLFCAGIHSFDFGPFAGYCDNCADELRADYCEEQEEGDWDYFEEYPV